MLTDNWVNPQNSIENNFQKVKILNGQKSSKNECRSSLGSKEAPKNHFKSFLGSFGSNPHFEKKVPENALKCPKMPYF